MWGLWDKWDQWDRQAEGSATMAGTRQIAVLFEPDALDLRQREIVRGVARYAKGHGDWQVSLEPHGHRAEAGAFDGVIASALQGRARALLASPAPFVLVTWGYEGKRVLRVVENRHGGARMAARHLADVGCQAFALLGFAKHSESKLHWLEFRRELRRRGLRVYRARVPLTYAARPCRRNKVLGDLGRWLRGLPTPLGLFVARPGLARAVADLALRQGLRVPEDIAIVAADDDPVLCELPPALSAIHYDYEELGWRAAQLLDRLMRGEPRPYKANVLIPPTLVPRLSTDRARLGDPLVAKALAYIDSRRTERFTLRALDEVNRTCDRLGPGDVAAAMGVGVRTLEKRVRAARGRTVAQEIALARVAHAKLCLEEGLLPLPVIAHESGFGSYAAMLRAFRVHVGKSPDAYRAEAALRRQGSADAEGYRKERARCGRMRVPGAVSHRQEW